MRKNFLFYLAAVAFMLLGGWLFTIFFGGLLNPGSLIVLAIMGILILLILLTLTHRIKSTFWIFAGLLILFALLLPATIFVRIFPFRKWHPLNSEMALTILMVISVGLIVVAMLAYSSLTNKISQQGSELQKNNHKFGPQRWIIISLSAILFVKIFHSFYWFMVWDNTGDSLNWLWLPIPFFAILLSTSILWLALPEKKKLSGRLYLLLVPIFILIYAQAQKVDFRDLTLQRAERISEQIETFRTQNGHYPSELRQIKPWYLVQLPGPVILYGEGWCYDGGEDYFRLGYINREHWSSPTLIGFTHQAVGDFSGLGPICEREAATLLERYSDNYWIFTNEGELPKE